MLNRGTLEIERLAERSRSALKRFDAVAHRVYRGDPHWVAPLRSQFEAVLGAGNPFWRHAECQLFVARRGGVEVGRIAAIRDRVFDEVYGEGTAQFGFFESVDDDQVARELFQAVFSWAKERGMERVLGPLNPSMNEECGLLVDGFDTSPGVMMTYAPSYYQRMVERAGFRKAKDLLAFSLEVSNPRIESLRRLASRFRESHRDLTVRVVTRRTLDVDVARIHELYNEVWKENWGAVPMGKDELEFLVSRLKPLLVDGLVWMATTTEEVAGILVAVPDANEIIKPLHGTLLSPGFFKALPYLLGWRRPRTVRVVVMGTRKKFRGLGLEAVMFAEGLARAEQLGFLECEASWVLEDNGAMRRMINRMGGKHTKTYRIYECVV